jgi:hypothetical protein
MNREEHQNRLREQTLMANGGGGNIPFYGQAGQLDTITNDQYLQLLAEMRSRGNRPESAYEPYTPFSSFSMIQV